MFIVLKRFKVYVSVYGGEALYYLSGFGLFRNRKIEEGETVSQYGCALKRLAQRAFPNETAYSLEVHVIDQYLNGLGHHELKKHITFKHPQSLEQAISYASEFEAIEGPIDLLRKPTSCNTESDKVLAVRQEGKKVVFLRIKI